MRWKKYADQLIEHCGEGKTIQSFCGKIGISKQTFYRWKKESKKFSEIVETAQAKSLLFWEEKLIESIDDKSINANTIKFVLGTRFQEIYSEKREMEQDNDVRIEIAEN